MPAPVIAVFDFDETLTTKHSLRPFVRYVVGTRRWLSGIVRSSPWLAASGAKRLREWLSKQPKSVLYDYGDNRGDREMLAMADRPWKRGDGPLPPLE